jgi:hypothetical protein
LITAQAGGGTGIGHTCDRCLIHRSCPRARANIINIKIDKFLLKIDYINRERLATKILEPAAKR